MKTQLLAVLFASLTVTPLARAAETPAPAAEPRHRLVGVILSTSQALLWDDESGEYQLRRVGDEMLGGRIIAMEEDVVILERGEVREEIGIAAPPQRRVAARPSRRLPAMIIQVGPGADSPGAAAALAPIAPQPAAPQAVPAPPAPAPLPQALPAMPQQPPSAPLFAPAPPAPPQPAPQALPPAPPPVPQAAPPAPQAPQPAAAPADPRGAAVMPLSRAQLEQEIGTMGGAQPPLVLSANPQGGFRINALRAGSLAEAIGLRPGDVVLRIDGRPINGVGDAASAYAWLRLTDQFSLDVVRDGRLVRLRYAFTA